jgi:hypothetical protein
MTEERLGGSTGDEAQQGPVDQETQLAKWRRVPADEGELGGADLEASREDREERREAGRSPPDINKNGPLRPGEGRRKEVWRLAPSMSPAIGDDPALAARDAPSTLRPLRSRSLGPDGPSDEDQRPCPADSVRAILQGGST